jgi:hypothetical protein
MGHRTTPPPDTLRGSAQPRTLAGLALAGSRRPPLRKTHGRHVKPAVFSDLIVSTPTHISAFDGDAAYQRIIFIPPCWTWPDFVSGLFFVPRKHVINIPRCQAGRFVLSGVNRSPACCTTGLGFQGGGPCAFLQTELFISAGGREHARVINPSQTPRRERPATL